MSDFAKGIIAGIIFSLLIAGVIMGLRYSHKKDKEIIEYAEKIQAVKQLREEYVNTDPVEFIDTIPDVRRAADGASDEFIRKRDEAVERFRSRLVD
jgi:hypothetical protein